MRPGVSLSSIKVLRQITAKNSALIVRKGGEQLARKAVANIEKRT